MQTLTDGKRQCKSSVSAAFLLKERIFLGTAHYTLAIGDRGAPAA
jgi:hypothetical protein